MYNIIAYSIIYYVQYNFLRITYDLRSNALCAIYYILGVRLKYAYTREAYFHSLAGVGRKLGIYASCTELPCSLQG